MHCLYIYTNLEQEVVTVKRNKEFSAKTKLIQEQRVTEISSCSKYHQLEAAKDCCIELTKFREKTEK